MREHFFNVIQSHDVPEDIQNRLDLLKTLTENGKNIKNVDDTIGEFTLNWIQAITEANLTQSFLEVIVNIIQYNAGYLDAKILAGYITCVHIPFLNFCSSNRCSIANFCWCSFPAIDMRARCAVHSTILKPFCNVCMYLMRLCVTQSSQPKHCPRALSHCAVP